jgi:hypothetical protein
MFDLLIYIINGKFLIHISNYFLYRVAARREERGED